MKTNIYGDVGFTENELIEHLRRNPDANINGGYLINANNYINACKESYLNMPKLMEWIEYDDASKEDVLNYHKELQSIWLMPDEFQKLDIQNYILGLCKTTIEINRVKLELELFEKNNLTNLLRYMLYLRQQAEKEKIVWGVGRGSSCCSYCLFLLKIHRVDSILYNLDIHEFLKEN
jgi:DNA polymerase III alpha subunit